MHEQNKFQFRLQYTIFLMSSCSKIFICQFSCTSLKGKKKRAMKDTKAFVLTVSQLFSV